MAELSPRFMDQAPAREPSTNQRSLKSIYFVSGLGADERVFSRLKVDGYHPVHVRWLPPHRGESLGQYAERLGEQILDPEPVLVGLSFGGLVAIELAKQMPTHKVVLLSSAKHSGEVPPYFKLFRLIPLHRVLPFKSLLRLVYWLVNWLFGLEDSNEKKLLKAVLSDTDPAFLKWALHRVVVWSSQQVPEGIHHIHGQRDRIFPQRWVEPTVTIDGGHFMVMNRAPAVSQLIKQALAEDSA